jgi:hypothetical protein
LAILWGFFVAIYVHFKLATNKKGPEAIKKAAQKRAQEIRDEIRLGLKEAELLEKIASGDIVYPWDDQEKFSKCAK